MSARGLRPSSGERGFTLIELSIVILIIAVVTRFAVPKLRSITGAELGASTRRIANTAHYLYEEAALRGTVLTLYIDLDRQQYWVGEDDDSADPEGDPSDPIERRHELPDGVRITDVIIPGAGKVSAGLVPSRFYPEGYADDSIIHLEDAEGHNYTVRIDPIRGRGEVSDGYRSFDRKS